MKSKYTKRARKTGNKKNMKMRKTRKVRKVRTRNVKSRKIRKTMKMRKTRKERNVKPQVGGGAKLDGELYQIYKDKDYEAIYKLYQELPEEYWYLKSRETLKALINDVLEEADDIDTPFNQLLIFMDKYKYDEFNEKKEELKKKVDVSKMSPKEKEEKTKEILKEINPVDTGDEIVLVEYDDTKKKVILKKVILTL